MIAAVAVVVVLFLVYFHETRTFDYWRKRGIKHDLPLPLFGNNARNYLFQKSITQVAADTYWKYPNEKVVGFFRSKRPELVIRDPLIVKRILVTDFVYFHARGLHPDTSVLEPLLRSLLLLDGDLWRVLRQNMMSMFSLGKLKAMFPLIVDRAEKLKARTILAAANGRPVDTRDLMARYTTDFIGAVGFGLDANSLNEENSAFRKLGFTIFNLELKHSIISTLKDVFPVLMKRFKYFERVERPMHNLVSEILKQRNHKPTGRNDFIDLLLERHAKGKLKIESTEKVNADGSPQIVSLELTDEVIMAQAFMFFAAGFETSSSASSFTLHQLAHHPEVQQKVHAEVDRVLARHGNKLTYDAVKEMTYLECAVKESLRLLPSVGFLKRECVRLYNVPELGVSIDKGVGVIIPLQALHNDPQYFEEPQQFRPERFLPEAAATVNKHVFLPFGDGPRACIAARLGMMQSLAGLAAVLSCVSVAPAKTSLRHPAVNPKANIIQSVKGGLPLMFRERSI